MERKPVNFAKLAEIISTMTDEELAFTGFVNSKTVEMDLDEIATSEKDISPAKPTTKEAEFEIYVSFDSKESGDKWLEKMGLLERFGDKDSIVINMADGGRSDG